MDRQDIQRLSDRIRTNEAEDIARLFADSGMETPRFVWSPEPAALEQEILEFLLSYWRSLPRETDLPPASEFRYVDMAFALGNLIVLDAVDDGWDYKYLYYGPEIIASTGSSMSGRHASEIEPGSYLPTFLIAAYRAVLLRRQPLFTTHKPPSAAAAEAWRRLILPLADDEDGSVCQLLVGSIPGGWQVLEQEEKSVA